jgi:MoaA/NifB/PqqE/SkfB family radical SAM enzyme
MGLALWRWGRRSPRNMLRVALITWNMLLSISRRTWFRMWKGVPVPWTIALSPTMRCNYKCGGCYSRGRREDQELAPDEIDRLFGEAREMGVAAVVLTGGEPLLCEGILNIVARYRRLLFFLITNGSLVTEALARQIADVGNVILLVSIEGFLSDTDGRRKQGAHEVALRALDTLSNAGACFGFAAMSTAVNIEHIPSDEFIGEMEDMGCAVGFVTEYIPCGSSKRLDWQVSEAARGAFRRRLLELAKRKRIVLIQFPQDEYGKENRCTAAGRSSLHISSRGDVEPCPFVPIACENIRKGGLLAALRSPFLRAIRERQDLLKRENLACSLFEHRAELQALARQFRSD